MNILIDSHPSDVKKTEIEQVQQQKMEYHILGTYLRTKGLKLFQYSPITEKVEEVEISYSNTLHLIPQDGVLVPVDLEAQKTVVDTRCIYFESLNMKNAEKRVNKWKAGKIEELFNLRDPEREPLVQLKYW